MLIYTVSSSLPKLTNLSRHLEDELDKAVRKTAFKLQQKAIERLTKAVYMHNKEPKPTGALRASIFVRTHRTDNYRQQMLRATARRAKADGGAIRLDLISEPPVKPKKGEAWVGVGMSYGIYIELPTRGRPGSYYMAGARADVTRFFFEECRKAILAAGQGDTIPEGFEERLSSLENLLSTQPGGANYQPPLPNTT